MDEKWSAYSNKEVLSGAAAGAVPFAAFPGPGRIVDSLLHPLAILIRSVLTRSGRRELDLILIDDDENILQALDAGVKLHSLYYSGGQRLSPELLRALPPDIGIHEVARRTCRKLFENDKVARVFAIAHAPVTPGLHDLLSTGRDIVALEGLTISGNIGAIIRTSLAFNAGGIVLLNAEPVDIYDRRLIRASRGHVFSLPVVPVTTDEFVRFCRQNELPVVATAARAESLMQDALSLAKPLVIVFGSEKDGSSQTLLQAASLQIQIPTHAKVESLNVSTAAAVVLYNRLEFNHPSARS